MHTDLMRLRKGRVGAQFWSVYVPANTNEQQAVQQTLEQIDVTKRLVARYPNDLALAATSAELEKAMKAGKVAGMMGMEGGQSIDLASRFSDDDLLECLRRLQKEHGYVTAQIIRDDELSPTPQLFTTRFGSLLNAYASAGIENRRSKIWSRAATAQHAARRAHRADAKATD